MGRSDILPEAQIRGSEEIAGDLLRRVTNVSGTWRYKQATGPNGCSYCLLDTLRKKSRDLAGYLRIVLPTNRWAICTPSSQFLYLQQCGGTYTCYNHFRQWYFLAEKISHCFLAKLFLFSESHERVGTILLQQSSNTLSLMPYSWSLTSHAYASARIKESNGSTIAKVCCLDLVLASTFSSKSPCWGF